MLWPSWKLNVDNVLHCRSSERAKIYVEPRVVIDAILTRLRILLNQRYHGGSFLLRRINSRYLCANDECEHVRSRNA